MEKLNYFIIFVLLGLAITCLYFSTNKKSGFQNSQKYDYYPVNTESNDYKSINDMIQLPNKDPTMQTDSLVVPTYSQENYIPSPNNQVLNLQQMEKLSKEQPEEHRKQTKMEVLNLCYQDVINDSINVKQAPKNMYITP
jgi:hypothetical protein